MVASLQHCDFPATVSVVLLLRNSVASKGQWQEGDTVTKKGQWQERDSYVAGAGRCCGEGTLLPNRDSGRRGTVGKQGGEDEKR